jgi:ribose/xylose/arabinose/galactoside ABC-type transport system permease subunit
MAVLENGGNLLGISPFVQRMAVGVLIVVVVASDRVRQSRES